MKFLTPTLLPPLFLTSQEKDHRLTHFICGVPPQLLSDLCKSPGEATDTAWLPPSQDHPGGTHPNALLYLDTSALLSSPRVQRRAGGASLWKVGSGEQEMEHGCVCLQITQELFMQVQETYVKAATDQQEETDECNATLTARNQSLSEIMNF